MAQTQPAEHPVEKLGAHLDALKDVRSLQAAFVCEKRLALLESPLVSAGRVWIGKGDARDPGGVRFLTDKPYVSDLILAGGKVYARSQHETEWVVTDQAARPGLTAVMTQLAGWSTGDAGKLMEMYAVAGRSGEVPTRPGSNSHGAAADIFELTPVNKDLAVAIKRLTLAIDSKTHQLLLAEILTQQDDVTRYWFYDVRLNGALPADVFKPGAAPATRATTGAAGGTP